MPIPSHSYSIPSHPTCPPPAGRYWGPSEEDRVDDHAQICKIPPHPIPSLPTYPPPAGRYWGASDEDRIDDSAQAFFRQHLPGVEFVDASALPYPPHHRALEPGRRPRGGGFRGWKVKVFAIYAAPFQEVGGCCTLHCC